MLNKKIARRYALALYGASEHAGSTSKVQKDFFNLKKTIEDSRELRLFLQTPIINSEKKSNVIEKLFSRKVNILTLKLLKLLCEKNRENFLYDITLDFLRLINEKKGLAEANVKTAIELSQKEKKLLTEKLRSYTGKSILASFSIDKSIKGGFVAQIEDTIIDASIIKQLELLHKQFKNASFS